MQGALAIGVLLLVCAAAYVRERHRRRTHPVTGGLHRDVALPHERDFELYHNALSLCSKQVRACLAELGIEAREHHVALIETGAYQNVGREFLAVNPAGLVPVLVHRGHPIYESQEILHYVAAHAPPDAPALVPGDAGRRLEMQRWLDRATLAGDGLPDDAPASAAHAAAGLSLPLLAALAAAVPTPRILEGVLFHRIKSRPLAFLVLKLAGLARLHRLGRVMRVYRDAAAAMQQHLDALEKQLDAGGGPWLLGGDFCLADVAWAAVFERLREAECAERLLRLRPTAAAYAERLRGRPSHAAVEAGPGHGVAEGRERLREAKAASDALRVALEAPCA